MPKSHKPRQDSRHKLGYTVPRSKMLRSPAFSITALNCRCVHFILLSKLLNNKLRDCIQLPHASTTCKKTPNFIRKNEQSATNMTIVSTYRCQASMLVLGNLAGTFSTILVLAHIALVIYVRLGGRALRKIVVMCKGCMGRVHVGGQVQVFKQVGHPIILF